MDRMKVHNELGKVKKLIFPWRNCHLKLAGTIGPTLPLLGLRQSSLFLSKGSLLVISKKIFCNGSPQSIFGSQLIRSLIRNQDSIMLILMLICLSSDDYSLVGLVSALPSEINSDFENC